MKQYLRKTVGAVLFLFALLILWSLLRTEPQTAAKSPVVAKTPTALQAAFSRVPLAFEENLGQTDPRVRYLARGSSYTIFLTDDDAVISLQDRQGDAAVLRLKVTGANKQARAEAGEGLPGKSNYFIGNDPAKWQTNVSMFAQVRYPQIYPGIDLVYHGNQRQLEYDFIVAPGYDPGAITLLCEGADKIDIDKEGELVLGIGEKEIRFRKPLVYQEINGARREVAARYVLKDKLSTGFEVAAYDTSKPLIIDPVLAYSTYLGGSGNETAQAIAVDATGSAYVAGYTNSLNFPTTAGAFRTTQPSDPGLGNPSGYVAKLNPAGNQIVYATYLGGSCTDIIYGIAVDAFGQAHVTGHTGSGINPNNQPACSPLQNPFMEFPQMNAFQSYGGGTDAFITKLSVGGDMLIYSSFIGGGNMDEARAVALDVSGAAYVTGGTITGGAFPGPFPTTPGAYQMSNAGSIDTFITKVSTAGTVAYSTLLGGGGLDLGRGIAVDTFGNAYVTGLTNSGSIDFCGSATSSPFPTTPGAYQPAIAPSASANCGTCCNGANQGFISNIQDAFVTKLNATGSALVYSTYLGGGTEAVQFTSAFDEGHAIAVDSNGNAYVTGVTASSNFPVTVNAVQPTYNGGSQPAGDAFVTKLDPAGAALVYSTYLGGSGYDEGNGIAVDALDQAHVGGTGGAAGFPAVDQIPPPGPTPPPIPGFTPAPPYGGFVTKFSASGNPLVYSTGIFGTTTGKGVALDLAGDAYATGDTQGFLQTVNPAQPNYAGSGDAYVLKLGPAAPPTCVPPPFNMISWWPGDDTTDDIVGGNTGIWVGTAAYTTGKVLNAFSFGGSSYVTAGAPPSLRLNGPAVTIDGWIYPTVDKPAIFFGKTAYGANDYVLLQQFPGPGQLGGELTGMINETIIVPFPIFRPFIPPLNTWTHLALSYDAATGTIKLYANGALIGTQPKFGNLFDSGSPFDIGGRAFDGFTDYNFVGAVDEVEVFDRALTDAEIAAIYAAGSAGKCKPTCTPTAEVCDGVDNDCDGMVDEDFQSTQTNCGVGACESTGQTQCVDGQVTDTCQPGSPTTETCNGIDDDCDGTVDDIPPTPTQCGTGACQSTGTLSCQNGQMVDSCTPGTPTTETCNGIDDDCDGAVDEETGGQACDGPDSDLCAEGTTQCVDGALSCSDVTSNNLDVCDGEDNDCNPQTADGSGEPAFGQNCDGNDSDLCEEGTGQCIDGELVCSDSTGDIVDVCDGEDNDCNPQTPDGSGEPAFGENCDGNDSDLCEEGTTQCIDGEPSCSDTTGDNVEVCDGIDNDCDGSVDEAAPAECVTGCVEPPPDMMSWWPADGNANDIQGPHDGTLQGDTGFAPGKVAQAFSFDANGDNVDVGDVDLATQFTMDAWIKPDSFASAPMIISKPTGAYQWFIRSNSVPSMFLYVTNASNQQTVYESAPSLVAGQWQHVTVTYDGTAAPGDRIRFYVNGQPIATSNVVSDNGGTPINDAAAATIGMSTSAGQGFDGLIDELEIFSRALSAAEIAAIHDAGSAGKCKAEGCDGIISTPTECGVGACASTGQTQCVNGQTVDTCEPGDPSPETCNGIDDDCDGAVDEETGGQACDGPDSDLCAEGTTQCIDGELTCSDTTDNNVDVCDGEDNDCNPQTADGSGDPAVGQNCDGPDADLCAEGTTQCIDGELACSDTTGDNAEVCDGADNDCNPQTADGSGDPDVGQSCDGDDADLCNEGVTQCNAGTIVCSDPNDADPDVCNGADDDCNPNTPDGSGDPGIGQSCDGPDADLCAEGTTQCIDGELTCSDATGDTADICNGVDDDCNPGTVDGSGDPSVGQSCDGNDADLCAEGTTQCSNGAVVCSDPNDADPDICNGVDDDCNPNTADGSGDPAVGQSCDGNDADLCNEGVTQCSNGAVVCSDPNDADPDICNGVDDDCNPGTADGSADPAVGQSCDGADADQCREGVTQCSNGTLSCSDTTGTNTETCNGIDDDCDGQTDEGLTCNGRVGTIGYWMNHPEAWCMETITIGCMTYTKAQAIAIMQQSTSTDMTYAMFAQLVAARLNVGCAGSNSSCVASAMTAADNWLCQNPVGSNVKANSQNWKSITSTYNTLVKYNEGKLCAPARK